MNKEDYILLVYQNLNGEITPDNFVELNKITAENPELAELRFDLEEAWDLSGETPQIVTPSDTSNLFKKITQAKKQASLEKARTISLKRIISGIAALFLITVGAYWFLKDQTTIYEKAGVYTLADQSVVYLREGSTLTIHSFTNKQRRVQLKGEAFFEISKDRDRTFIVESSHTQIKVLGTSFLVKEEINNTYVDLIEGKINVQDTRSLQSKEMQGGSKVLLNGQGEITVINKLNNLSAWKDGIYQYEDITLKEGISELAIIFNTIIEIENQSLEDCTFSAILRGESIKDLLNRIASRFDLVITQENNKWILSGGKCN